MKKLPPIEKVYEAYSAIADGRVKLFEDGAKVISSGGDKEYDVKWGRGEQGNDVYFSNDNASYWQGYAGYPVIAVLMLKGKLPLDKSIMAMFKGANWAELNASHRQNYSKAVQALLQQRNYGDEEAGRARLEAERVHKALSELDIDIKRGKRAVKRR
ncbi:MAG: hypothetical protein ACOX8S_08730 [Christensenellales bacterium]|jgi:hypothetical protein